MTTVGVNRDRWWFTPAAVVLAPVLLSFAAWAVVVGPMARDVDATGSALDLVGFDEPAAVTVPGVMLLVGWYLAIALLATIGWRLGRAKVPDATVLLRTSSTTFERRYFRLVLMVAAVGVGYCYYRIGTNTSIVDALTTQTGNDFTNSLSGTAGVETLRYASILAAPVAVYLKRRGVIGRTSVIAAVTLLLLNAMIASRLSLLMAGVVYLAIWIRTERRRAPGTRSTNHRVVLVVVLVGLFAALTTMNYVRNANYYREAGVSDPVAMNLYQMGAYLAVPAQVSLGVSDAVMRGSYVEDVDADVAFDSIKPTWLQTNKVAKDDDWVNAGTYGYNVSLAPNFTTNSVFADTYAHYGLLGWLFTLLLYPLTGYLFGRIFRFGPVVAGSAGIVAYCLAEVWRVQILNFGIVIFLLLLTAAASILAARHRDTGDQQVSY